MIKEREVKKMNSTYIIIGIIAVIFLAIIFYIKTTIDEKKGENSEEKKRVKEIVEKVTKDSEYKNIYATWEEWSQQPIFIPIMQ